MVVGNARDVRTRDPRHRTVEAVERLLGDDRRDLCPVATEPVALVDDQALAGLADRIEDGLLVERSKGPEVDDLDADVLFGYAVAGLEPVVGHEAVGDARHLR